MGEPMVKELQSGGSTVAAGPSKEIDLKELVGTVTRRLWILIVSTILLGSLGGLISAIPVTPMYSASARIMLTAGTPELIGTLRALIKEPVVMGRAIQESGLQMTENQLRARIAVQSVDTSVITLVSAIDSDPEAAAMLANAVANAFIEEAKGLLYYDGAKLMSPATVDPSALPINPASNRALYLGILGGIALGIGLIFLVDSLDDSVRSGRNLESKLGIKCLGEVPSIRRKDWFSKNKRKNEYTRGESIGS
ncbi:YveK family protein [Paenibacillus sp. sgz500958]|uniref:YveK family protein n=1 Tax=Paenibacillus sp. sgz500958 TaxID=3242475 RepID=UPI0036D3CDFD